MTSFKFTLAYDGTDFVGWQRQANGRSVQALVEEALARIEGAAVAVAGASRTDAGVHALGQVASAMLTREIDASALRRALNATLPADVRALSVEPAPADFHARFAARAKTYRYRLIVGDLISPFERRFAWHVPVALNTNEMQRAATRFEGRHDFAAFRSVRSGVKTTVRTITKSRLMTGPQTAEGHELVYEITGDGFLRHMVRAIVGTLVEVGEGRRRAEAVDEILASHDRQQAGPTAPAHGLCLVEVTYGE